MMAFLIKVTKRFKYYSLVASNMRTFEELRTYVKECPLQEFDELIKDKNLKLTGGKKLNETQKDILNYERRKHTTQRLEKIIQNSLNGSRTIYEKTFAFTEQQVEEQSSEFLLRKSEDDSYFFMKEQIEDIFENKLFFFSNEKLTKLVNEAPWIKFCIQENLLFSGYAEYVAKDRYYMDCLVTKDNIVLMQYLLTAHMDTPRIDIFLIAPEYDNFEQILNGELGIFNKRKTEDIEKEQPRTNIFAEYIRKNRIDLNKLAEVNPAKDMESDAIMYEDLKERYFKWIIYYFDEGIKKTDGKIEYCKEHISQLDKLLEGMSRKMLKFKTISKDTNTQDEAGKIKIEMSYDLIEHYARNSIDEARELKTKIICEQISNFEKNNPELIKKLGYNPIKRKLRLLE
jgi:hypothetical protein